MMAYGKMNPVFIIIRKKTDVFWKLFVYIAVIVAFSAWCTLLKNDYCKIKFDVHVIIVL